MGETGTVLECAFSGGWSYRLAMDDPTKASLADVDAPPLEPGDPGYGEAWITGQELNAIPDPS